MSRKERTRLTIMTGVTDGDLTLVQAAKLMGVRYRQGKRIWKRYQVDGDAGLVHWVRGKPSAQRKARRDAALLRPCPRQHHRDRLEQNFHVQPQRPVVDVF